MISFDSYNVNRTLAREASGRRWPAGSTPGVLPCAPREDGFYPNVDLSIWLRSCTQETTAPLEGRVSGTIPSWLDGSLVMNGPGKFFFGDQVVNHLFDGSALLQKYHIR